MSAHPFRLIAHEALPSTSDLLITLARAGEPGDLAVLAARQTAGRGTQGRGWASHAGNLHLSVLLRPAEAPRQVAQWSLLAAVALADALFAAAPAAPLTLKWPNDVVLGEAKLAGILAETALRDDGKLDWLVLGFGVNLAHAPNLPDRPTAALGGHIMPAALAEALLASLHRWRRVRMLEGFAPIRSAWLARGPVHGAPLTLRTAAAAISGRFEGLDEHGALLLASGGRVHAVAAGEVAR